MDKKKIIIGAVAVALVGLILWIGFFLSSPRRVISKFEDALQKNDYTAAEELMAPLGILAGPNDDELSPAEFKQLFSELAGQSTQVRRLSETSWRKGHHMDPDMYYPTTKHWAGYYRVFLAVRNDESSTPLMLEMRKDPRSMNEFSRFNYIWGSWEIYTAAERIAGFGQ